MRSCDFRGEQFGGDAGEGLFAGGVDGEDEDAIGVVLPKPGSTPERRRV